MRLAFMSSTKAEASPYQVPTIHDVFEDNLEFWIGYPLSERRVAYRPTLYLCERCRLAGLFQVMHDLIFPDENQRNTDIKEFASATDRILTRMRLWYHRLPFELHYVWPMNVAIGELQFVLPFNPTR